MLARPGRVASKPGSSHSPVAATAKQSKHGQRQPTWAAAGLARWHRRQHGARPAAWQPGMGYATRCNHAGTAAGGPSSVCCPRHGVVNERARGCWSVGGLSIEAAPPARQNRLEPRTYQQFARGWLFRAAVPPLEGLRPQSSRLGRLFNRARRKGSQERPDPRGQPTRSVRQSCGVGVGARRVSGTEFGGATSWC